MYWLWGAISVSLTKYNLLTSEFCKKSPIPGYLEICILHKNSKHFWHERFKMTEIWVIAAWWSNWTFSFLMGSNFHFVLKFQCQFWTQRPLRKVSGDMVVCILTKPPHLTPRPGNAILVRLNWQSKVFLTVWVGKLLFETIGNYETFNTSVGKVCDINWWQEFENAIWEI